MDGTSNKKLHYNRNVKKCEWLIRQGIRPVDISFEEGYVVFETTSRYKKFSKLYDQTIDSQS